MVIPALLGERTGIQGKGASVTYSLATTTPLLYRPPVSYDTYRKIRKDPTLSMVRTLIAAGIVAAGRSMEKDDDVPDDMHTFVVDQLFPHQDAIVERAVLSGIDFGWGPWEIVLALKDGRIVLDKVKPLLQDITKILIDKKGNFVGFQQHLEPPLPFETSFLIPWRVEGSNWYGEPLLENARDVFTQWTTASKTAQEYDMKVAGTRLVIYYPPGECRDKDGLVRPNSEIASDIRDVLEVSGSVTVPTTAAQWVDELEKQSTGWRIEVLDDKGPHPSQAIERLKYLDANKARALGMPERVILEGEVGVKTDSVVPAQFALKNLELMHSYVCRHIQKIIDLLLELNFGAEWIGKVYLTPAPLLEEGLKLLADIAQLVVPLQPDAVDLDGLLDKLHVPKKKEVVDVS